MNIYEVIDLLRKSPEVLVLRPSKYSDYYNFCAFINGFSLGREPNKISGFYEWLNMQFPRASPAHWVKLILQLAFPEGPPENWADNKDSQQLAINALLDNLEAFLNERNASPDSLAKILRKHKEFEIRTRKAVRDREQLANKNQSRTTSG